MALVIPGKDIARSLGDDVATRTGAFRARHGFAPALAVIRVGDDPASPMTIACLLSNTLKAARASVDA